MSRPCSTPRILARFALSSAAMSTRAEIANRWITGLAAAPPRSSILALQLLVPPVVGLADNGDYQRVMGYAGFEHSTDDVGERYFAFLRTSYRVLPVGCGAQRPPLLGDAPRARGALASRGAQASAASSTSAFSAASTPRSSLLALGRAAPRLPRPAIPAQASAAVLGVFFFTDVGYAAPFNSFYGQTASLLFLLLTAAVAAPAIRAAASPAAGSSSTSRAPRRFVASKPQEAIQGPVLALLGVGLAGVPLRGRLRRPAAWLALALCAFSVWYGRRTPDDLKEAALYQVVFYEILPHSPIRRRTPPRSASIPVWLRYSGTDAFRPDTPLLDPGSASASSTPSDTARSRASTSRGRGASPSASRASRRRRGRCGRATATSSAPRSTRD